MDSRHFDALTRVFSANNSRRRVLAGLASLPVLGGLLGLLETAEIDAAGRRKRRKKAHKHGERRRRKHKHTKKPQQCVPNSLAQTCAGKCDSVINNCQQAVACGSCACDPLCTECFVCDPQTGQCGVDPQQQGEACGSAGQVCQADGACVCDASSCPDCTACAGNGACQACSDCCDGSGVCQDGDTNAACGSSGTCDVCTGQEQCQNQACVCVPETSCPAENDCGTVSDGCDGQIACGVCNHPDPVCVENVCGPCTSSAQCPSETICDAGACVACDVCAGDCPFSSINVALNATNPRLDTIRICPGTYRETAEEGSGFAVGVLIARPVTILGAGDGVDPATNTILRPVAGGPVIYAENPGGPLTSVRIEGMRMTDGGGERGRGITFWNTTGTVANCSIVQNQHTQTYESGGGLGLFANAHMTLVNTQVVDNKAYDGGGVRVLDSTLILDTLSRIIDNKLIIDDQLEPGTVGGILAGGASSVELSSVDNVTNNVQSDCGGDVAAFTGPGAICTTT